MSEGTAAAAHAGHSIAWPPDAQYGSAAPAKIGMWIFLVSDAFGFGGLLIAYAILRSREAVWRAAAEPAFGVGFTVGLTIILFLSSVTNVLAWVAASEGRRRQAQVLLALTALGGALFIVGQYQEWFGLWSSGLMHEGLVFGRSARASTFYAVTGYHGLHVIVGVLYILVILRQYSRGVADVRHVELLSLYWCFVDFVWAFIFSFIYLIP